MTTCSRTLQDVVAIMTRDSSALFSDSEFDSDIESASDISDGPSLPETTRTQENVASSDREPRPTGKVIDPIRPAVPLSRTPLREKQAMPSQLQMGSKCSKVTRVDLSLDVEGSSSCSSSNPCKKKKVSCKHNENIDLCDESETTCTNTLLLSLIKRMDRQEKKIHKMQNLLDDKVAVLSSGSSIPPSRTYSRRKMVPLEVRVPYFFD